MGELTRKSSSERAHDDIYQDEDENKFGGRQASIQMIRASSPPHQMAAQIQCVVCSVCALCSVHKQCAVCCVLQYAQARSEV